MHHGDGLRGQFQIRIELADRGVVPRPDLAEKDPGGGGSIEDELGALDALDVDHHGDAAHDGRELHESVGVQVGGAQGHVGGAEGHLLALDLPDPLTRADRLIVDGDAALFLVGLGPFRVDRVREGRAGAGDFGSGDSEGCERGSNNGAHCRDDATNLHAHTLYFWDYFRDYLPSPTGRMAL